MLGLLAQSAHKATKGQSVLLGLPAMLVLKVMLV